MIEIIKAAFFAGEVKTFLIAGEYLEILEAAYPLDVAMLDRNGVQLSNMRNAEASYFSRPGKYDTIQVTSSSAQTVRLFVGSGDAGTRKTSGDVSVIDGAKNRTVAGRAYIGANYQSAVPGQYSKSQLWNPAGSGKNLILGSFSMQSSIGGQLNVRSTSGALALAGPTLAGSKLVGDAVPFVGMLRVEAAVGVVDAVLASFLFQANVNIQYSPKEPFVLRPGYGVMVNHQTGNADLNVVFEWFEETI